MSRSSWPDTLLATRGKALGVKTGGRSLHPVTLPHSSFLVSPRKELVPLSGTLISAAATQGHPYVTWLEKSAGLPLVGLTE